MPAACGTASALPELFAANTALFTVGKLMIGYWKLWVDLLNLGHEAQRVIAMRLARIAAGGPAADAECRRIISEKFAAVAAARAAAAAALAAGKGVDAAASLALVPVQKAVRGNHRRLTRIKRFDEVKLAVRRAVRGAGHVIGRVLRFRARTRRLLVARTASAKAETACSGERPFDPAGAGNT